jgi:hypothetical protein
VAVMTFGLKRKESESVTAPVALTPVDAAKLHVRRSEARVYSVNIVLREAVFANTNGVDRRDAEEELAAAQREFDDAPQEFLAHCREGTGVDAIDQPEQVIGRNLLFQAEVKK